MPAPQEPAAGGDRAERGEAGPGGRAESLRSGIAHYLEDPQPPEALGRAASRKPKHPGALASLSSAGSEPGSTRAPRGRDTVRGQMPAGIPALSLPTTNPALTPPPPRCLPTSSSPPHLGLLSLESCGSFGNWDWRKSVTVGKGIEV